jgi:hypothetical protein
MMKIPTDRKILELIYKEYKNTFKEYIKGDDTRESRIYVPIDCAKLAEKLNTDRDIVFGRLYYYLDQKYGYKRDDGSSVHLFSLAVGKDVKCVNFPMLASVLASLRSEYTKFIVPIIVSTISVIVALVSAGTLIWSRLP